MAWSRAKTVRLAVLTLATVAVGAWAAQDAIVAATRTMRPGVALTFRASDAGALVRLADVIYFPRLQEPAPRRTAKSMAMRALRTEPLNAKALRLLANVDKLNGKPGDAERLAGLGLQVSRRDAGLNLWFIEQAARARDLPAVLRNLDRAMRPSTAIRSRLFPFLLQALTADPTLRDPFAQYIRRNPPWLFDFMEFAITEAADARGLAGSVIAAGGLPNDPAYRPLESFLLTKLADQQRYALARRLFETMRGGKPSWAASADFAGGGTDPAFVPITWQAYTSPDFTASFAKSGDAKAPVVLQAAAYSPQTFLAARKLLFVPPGRYRFAVNAERGSTDGAEFSATWRVRCGVGNDLPVIAASPEITKTGTFGFTVDVPAKCEALVLELLVSGSVSSDSAEMDFTQLSLKPVASSVGTASPTG